MSLGLRVSRWVLTGFVLWVLTLANLVAAAEPVKVAVLAFRPKAMATVHLQSLADVLKAAIPERDFVVIPMTLSEIDTAVSARQVDFVLTNPGHFVMLQRRVGLQAPLATLLTDESGSETAAFGGVIFARADSPRLTALTDIKGQKIAAVDTASLGGFQMQAYELLQAGIHVAKDNTMVFTGVPHDGVINAVLTGQADVGFVRTGILESMAREGKLKMEQVQVLNAQNRSNFPARLSTALYPEWPMSRLGHVDERLARRVAAALFLMQNDTKATHAMGIRGFTVPADYTPVADMLRAMRLPPFELAPTFTWRDVAMRFRLPLLFGSLGLGLIVLLSLWLWLTTRRLQWQQRQVLAQKQALQNEVQARQASEADIAKSRALLLSVIDHVPMRVFWKDRSLHYMGCNTLFAHDGGQKHPQDVVGKTDFDFTSADNAPQYRADDTAVMDSGQPKLFFEEQQTTPDGRHVWLRTSKVPLRGADGEVFGVLGIYEDTTEHRLAEQKLQLAASVFSHAREAIVITDTRGTVVDVNDAFTTITGYTRDDVLGHNARPFIVGKQEPAFCADMEAELAASGHWFGEVWSQRKSGGTYAALLTFSAVCDAKGAITHHVAMFFDITAIKEHQKQLEHIAHFDALTGLPNRVLLADRMHQAMAQVQRRGQLLAVAYLDLDGFKTVNDRHGHDAGDQLLIVVAGAMREVLREGDTLARIGGDEFVAVLTDLQGSDDCASTLQRLLDAAAQPVTLGDLELNVSASLGVTFYPQVDNNVDADQLMRQADQAMYQAKLAGKNRFHVFDAVQDRSVRGLHERIDAIAVALEAQEFVLFYQPKVNLRTGQVVGSEALIRWQHPSRGLLSPAAFLPLIEDHSLSVALGDWVIDAALAQLTHWHERGLTLPVSVNVSARQIQRDDFVPKLQAALARFPKVPSQLLTMEVLETSALTDLGRTAKLIEACGQLGVQFALDDFGTGYSSLTYLKHLPVNLIKIDQSFVRDMLDDPDDLAILEGVIGLAHAFKRQVIAEGMETAQQGQRLLALGCELAQGYGIARPMPAADMPAWLATWQPDPLWQQP